MEPFEVLFVLFANKDSCVIVSIVFELYLIKLSFVFKYSSISSNELS
jgi:hypothetical protein